MGCVRGWGWVAVALATAAACTGANAFMCSDDSQCSADVVDGVCQPDGLCSFPDPDCDSGQRYGENTGSLAGQCVPVAGTTGVVATSTTTGPPTPDDSTGPGATSALDPTTSTTSGPPPGDSSSAGSGSSTGEPVDPSLVLWLPFERDQPFADASTYANGVDCANDVCPTAAGGDATFDGQGQALQILDAPHFDTPGGFTLATWVQLDPIADFQIAILTKPLSVGIFNTWELYYYRESDTEFSLYLCMAELSSDACTSVSLAIDNASQWHHVAATYDPPTATLWLDGAQAGSFDSTGFVGDTGAIFVGADRDNGMVESFFTGSLDDIRVYDRALDPSEIEALAMP